MSLILFTSVAMAAGAEGPPDMNAIAFHAINFFLLISLLTFLLRNKIKDALANRAARVRNDIDKSTGSGKHSRSSARVPSRGL